MIIRHRLRLDALGRVHDEQRSFAGTQAPRHFVREIHVAGRINQVQLVGLTVFGLVEHRDRMRLDGDATFALQIHRIQQLRLHVARGDGSGAMQEAVRQRRLPMVNMGNDAEIAYMRCVHLQKSSERRRIAVPNLFRVPRRQPSQKEKVG